MTKYIRKRAAPRSLSPLIQLTPQDRERTYLDAITRMRCNGVCSDETADKMQDRVTNLSKAELYG